VEGAQPSMSAPTGRQSSCAALNGGAGGGASRLTSYRLRGTLRRAVLLIMAGLLLAPVASAQETSDTPPGAMLIILDASGSMNRADEDGVPFIDKAKNAVVELIDALPDDIKVGLRVYGHREPNTDRTRGCLDTELVAPVVTLDRDAIRSAVAGVSASGFTPIGLSLQEAASDLPETGPRTVVLVSDGEDTCAPPDPCDVAEELFGAAVDVRIESIGFLVDSGSAAEQQLRCIADVSGGEYRTVDRADELVARLGEVAGEFLDWKPPVVLNGALEQARAPEVPLELVPDWLAEEPPTFALGRYASVIMPGETRWFRIDTWEGEWFRAFADLSVPRDLDAPGEVEAIIIGPSGNRVEKAATDMSTRVALPGTEFPMIGVTVDSFDRPYPTGTYLLGFHWDAPARVLLGSLVVDVDILGDGREAKRTRLDGSLDPDTAPILDLEAAAENGPDWAGNGFIGSLTAGETRWYRIDGNPGATVYVEATFPAYRADGVNGQFTVDMRDLDGTPIVRDPSESTQTIGTETHQAVLVPTATAPWDSVPSTVLVGFRWEGGEGATEVRFGVETTGGDKTGTIRSAVTTTQLPAETSTHPVPSTTEVAAATEPAANEPSGAPVAVFIVIGVAALAVVGAAIVPMRRRRSR